MIPSNRIFNEEWEVTIDGTTYYRCYRKTKIGKHRLFIKFIHTNGKRAQGIALFFYKDFKGTVKLDGEKLKIFTGFKHHVFREDTMPKDEMTLDFDIENGTYIIQNGAVDPRVDLLITGVDSCAFWIEEISENHLRFHCNDYEFNDDFDDLIFDMIITEID